MRVVEPDDGADADAGELAEHVTRALAAYKAPAQPGRRRLASTAPPNGKVDYKGLRLLAIDRVG